MKCEKHVTTTTVEDYNISLTSDEAKILREFLNFCNNEEIMYVLKVYDEAEDFDNICARTYKVLDDMWKALRDAGVHPE